MKHLLKIYILVFIFFSDFKMFAQEDPGDEGDGPGGVEGSDPQVPINGKLLILIFAGILFAFYHFKNNQKVTSQE